MGNSVPVFDRMAESGSIFTTNAAPNGSIKNKPRDLEGSCRDSVGEIISSDESAVSASRPPTHARGVIPGSESVG